MAVRSNRIMANARQRRSTILSLKDMPYQSSCFRIKNEQETIQGFANKSVRNEKCIIIAKDSGALNARCRLPFMQQPIEHRVPSSESRNIRR